MNSLTIRFLATYEYLKKTKKVQNPSSFAEMIEVSTSLITEICKKRTNAGITPIQNLLERFPEIDANWLLTGKGSMIRPQNSTLEENINYKELAEARLEIIELKNEKIENLTQELRKLKKETK